MSYSSWLAATPQEYFGYPDDDEWWCSRHDQAADGPCSDCVAESQEEERMAHEAREADADPTYRARMLDDLEDLPY